MTAAKSFVHLAAIAKVHRRRVNKWRAAGAPAGLDLDAWAAWAGRTGRTRIAARLREASQTQSPPPRLVETPPGPGSAGAQQETLTLPQPPVSIDEACGREQAARVLRAEEDAARARLERLRLEGALVPLESLDRFLAASGGLLLEILGTRIWQALLPELDAAPAAQRRRLRQAHDRGIAAVRAEYAASGAALRDRVLAP
jgi:hypothetical protein